MIRAALLIAAALALAGCSSTVEPLVLPSPPQAWKAKIGAQANSIPHSGALLDDPAWNGIASAALAGSPDIATAKARTDAAWAATGSAEAERRPRLGFVLRGSRSDIWGRGDSPATTSIGYDFDITFDPDLFGRLRSQARAARLDAHVSELDTAVARQVLLLSLGTELMRLRAADRQNALLQSNRSMLRKTKGLIAMRVRQGVAAGIDIDRSEADLARLELEQISLERERDGAETRIAILSGQAPSRYRVARLKDGRLPKAGKPDIAAMPAALLESQPGVLAALLRLEASGARLEAARAQLFPAFSLSASIGQNGVNLSRMLSAAPILSISGSIIRAIFDAGARQAAIRQSESERRAVLADYHAAMLRAVEEVETALADESTASKRLRLIARQTGLQRRVVAAERVRLAGGSEGAAELLREEANLLALERDRVAANAEQNLARFRLGLLANAFASMRTGR